MSEWPAGLIKIALIEPEASQVAWVMDLARADNVPAEIVDSMAAQEPHLENAEIILIGLDGLGETEREALIRLHAGFPRTPLIVLAGPGAASRAGEAVSFGASYAIPKSELTAAKLSSLIRYYADYARDRSAPSAATA